MGIIIKTSSEIALLQKGGLILGRILQKVAQRVKPGISTLELDILAENLIKQEGGEPSFKGYRGFPATLCTSVNEEVVHGIPSAERILKEGDIIDLDIGMKYQGLFTDMSMTVGVGKIDQKARELIEVTYQALLKGIAQVAPGKYTGDIGFAIQNFVEKRGFSVVRELVGHGVGKKVHEEPDIPNYGKKGEGVKLRKGMVIAIEPMVNQGDWRIIIKDNGWTAVTADHSLSAHFEQTVAVTEKGYQILTPLFFP